MPGSRVRVPPLLSSSQSLTGGWLESFRGVVPTDVPVAIGLSGWPAIGTGSTVFAVNPRYRICFRWEAGYADEVEVTNY